MSRKWQKLGCIRLETGAGTPELNISNERQLALFLPAKLAKLRVFYSGANRRLAQNAALKQSVEPLF
jgi:hypothetical protein